MPESVSARGRAAPPSPMLPASVNCVPATGPNEPLLLKMTGALIVCVPLSTTTDAALPLLLKMSAPPPLPWDKL